MALALLLVQISFAPLPLAPRATCGAPPVRARQPLLRDAGAPPGILGLPADVAAPASTLLALQLILFVGVGAVIPVLPLYADSIGLSSAANGVVIGAPALALLLLARPAGAFADRARKPAMLSGMALIVAADLGTASASALGPLVAARIALGAGRCISESGERGYVADLANRAPQTRGKLLAAQQAAAALGIAVGAPAGGVVVGQYGARAAFLCVSAAAALTFCGYLFLPETTVDSQPSRLGSSGRTRGKRSSGDQSRRDDAEMNAEAETEIWLELLRDPRWRGLAACEVGAKFCFAAKIALVPVLAAAALPGGAVGAGVPPPSPHPQVDAHVIIRRHVLNPSSIYLHAEITRRSTIIAQERCSPSPASADSLARRSAVGSPIGSAQP